LSSQTGFVQTLAVSGVEIRANVIESIKDSAIDELNPTGNLNRGHITNSPEKLERIANLCRRDWKMAL